jgi:hypothetical protein
MEPSILQTRVVKLAVLLVVIALPSCGRDGGPSETASRSAGDPEKVVHRYFAALARGDGRTSCALMTTVGQDGMKQLPQGEQAGSCERAVALLARDSIPVPNPVLRDLRISGRTATGRVTSADGSYENGILLRQEATGWKIAFPVALASRFDSPPGIRPHEEEDEAHE